MPMYSTDKGFTGTMASTPSKVSATPAKTSNPGSTYSSPKSTLSTPTRTTTPTQSGGGSGSPNAAAQAAANRMNTGGSRDPGPSSTARALSAAIQPQGNGPSALGPQFSMAPRGTFAGVDLRSGDYAPQRLQASTAFQASTALSPPASSFVSRPYSYAGPKGAKALNTQAKYAAVGGPDVMPRVTLSPKELDEASRLLLAEVGTIRNTLGGKSTAAMQGVAEVLRNRVLSSQFPNNLNDVMHARETKRNPEFTPFGNPAFGKEYGNITQFSSKSKGYDAARAVVQSTFDGTSPPIAGSALNYGNVAHIMKPTSAAKAKTKRDFSAMEKDATLKVVDPKAPGRQTTFGTLGGAAKSDVAFNLPAKGFTPKTQVADAPSTYKAPISSVSVIKPTLKPSGLGAKVADVIKPTLKPDTLVPKTQIAEATTVKAPPVTQAQPSAPAQPTPGMTYSVVTPDGRLEIRTMPQVSSPKPQVAEFNPRPPVGPTVPPSAPKVSTAAVAQPQISPGTLAAQYSQYQSPPPATVDPAKFAVTHKKVAEALTDALVQKPKTAKEAEYQTATIKKLNELGVVVDPKTKQITAPESALPVLKQMYEQALSGADYLTQKMAPSFEKIYSQVAEAAIKIGPDRYKNAKPLQGNTQTATYDPRPPVGVTVPPSTQSSGVQVSSYDPRPPVGPTVPPSAPDQSFYNTDMADVGVNTPVEEGGLYGDAPPTKLAEASPSIIEKIKTNIMASLNGGNKDRSTKELNKIIEDQTGVPITTATDPNAALIALFKSLSNPSTGTLSSNAALNSQLAALANLNKST